MTASYVGIRHRAATSGGAWSTTALAMATSQTNDRRRSGSFGITAQNLRGDGLSRRSLYMSRSG